MTYQGCPARKWQSWLCPQAPAPSALGTACLPGGGCSASEGRTCALPRRKDSAFPSLEAALMARLLGPSKREKNTRGGPSPPIRNWGVGMWIERQDPPEGAKNGPTPFLWCPLPTSVLPGYSCLVPSKTGAAVRTEPQAATTPPPRPLLGDHSALLSEDPRFLHLCQPSSKPASSNISPQPCPEPLGKPNAALAFTRRQTSPPLWGQGWDTSRAGIAQRY